MSRMLSSMCQPTLMMTDEHGRRQTFPPQSKTRICKTCNSVYLSLSLCLCVSLSISLCFSPFRCHLLGFIHHPEYLEMSAVWPCLFSMHVFLFVCAICMMWMHQSINQLALSFTIDRDESGNRTYTTQMIQVDIKWDAQDGPIGPGTSFQLFQEKTTKFLS